MTNNNEVKEEIEKEEVIDEKEEVIDEKEGTDIEDLTKSKENEVDELKGQLLRLQADFINYKKRAEKDKENTIAYAIEEFSLHLLPILDNFERAIEVETNKEGTFYQGIEMIYKQLLKALNDNGVNEIKALNEAFDPSCHHAVIMEDSSDHEEGIVIEVFQKGYKIKDKTIRPCMVKVSK